MTLTDRDLDLLEALATRVRLLTIPQVAAAWWSSSADVKTAARRVAKLVAARFLVAAEVIAAPLLPLAEPVVRWNPGDGESAWPAIAWRLQSRWRSAPLRVTAVLASPRAVALVGGAAPGRLKNVCQATHDLHVGQVFIAYRRRSPELARQWVGEDRFAPYRVTRSLPDAVLIDGRGVVTRAVEFGGRYSAERLARFHADLSSHSLPYEIW